MIEGSRPSWVKYSWAKRQVGVVHREPALGDERGEALLVELAEAVEHLDRLGVGNLHLKGLGLLERGDARLDGVHHVVLDGGDGVVGELTFEDVNLCGANGRALALADELNALARGVPRAGRTARAATRRQRRARPATSGSSS